MKRWLPMALLGLVCAAACGPAGERIELPRYSGEPNGDDAALVGVLAVNDRQCMVVRSEDGSETLLAVASRVSIWDGEQDILIVSGVVLRIGDEVVFGGSGMSVSRVGDIGWSTAPTSTCLRGYDYIWLAGDRPSPLSDVPQLRPRRPGDPVPPDPTPWHSATYREALEKDAATYAAEHGVSLAEAIIVLERQAGLVATPTPRP